MSYKLYQRKTKGKKWYVRFTARGKQYRVTTGETDHDHAERVACRIYQRVLDGAVPQDRQYTTDALILDYMADLRRRECVMETMECHANFWSNEITGRLACHVSMTDLVGALDKLAYSRGPATYNRYLAFIKAAYNCAIRFEYLEVNPASKISKKREIPRDTFLKPAQIQHVFNKYSEMNWVDPILGECTEAAFILAISTGIRARELLTLGTHDVDFEAGTITLQAGNTKSGKKRTIPVPSQILNRLKNIPCVSGQFFGYIKYRNLSLAAEWISKWTGCEVKWHDLRHTFAVAARRNGMDMMTLMRMLGHSDIASTQRYAEFGDDTEYITRFMPDYTEETAKC